MKTLVIVLGLSTCIWAHANKAGECRGEKFNLRVPLVDSDLAILREKIMPKIKNSEVQHRCRTLIGETRAALKNGGWNEMSGMEKTIQLEMMMSNCCDRKK